MIDARSSHPSYFRGETFDMVFFALEDALRNEHGEVGVLYAEFFDARVEPFWRIISTMKRLEE